MLDEAAIRPGPTHLSAQHAVKGHAELIAPVHAVRRDLDHLPQRGAELTQAFCCRRGLTNPDIEIVLCLEAFRRAEAVAVRLGQVADLAPVACRECAVSAVGLCLIRLDAVACLRRNAFVRDDISPRNGLRRLPNGLARRQIASDRLPGAQNQAVRWGAEHPQFGRYTSAQNRPSNRLPK